MSNVNGVIEKKLALLEKHLSELQKNMEGVDLARFRDDYMLKCMAERSLQIMIEIVIDIAERIIALRQAGPVDSSSQAIERLVQLGILKSSQPYVDMIRFRNLIVHQYSDIDPELTFRIVKNELDSFHRFRDEIDDYAG